MNEPIVMASGPGIEALIWIVIMIFWGIAQVIQKSKAQQRRPSGAPPRPAPQRPENMPPVSDEIRELLKELTGQTVEIEELEPEPEPAPPPPPPRRQMAPRTQSEASHQRTQQRRLSEDLPSAPVLRRPDFTTPLPMEGFKMPSIEGGTAAALTQGIRSAIKLMPQHAISMKGLSVAVPSGIQRNGNPPLRLAALRNTATLKQMVLARMVLDRPVGLRAPGASDLAP